MTGAVEIRQGLTFRSRLCLKLHTAWNYFSEIVSGRWIARLAESMGDVEDETEERELSRQELNRRAEELLDLYGNHILRLAYPYLHNMEDSEEILQEMLLKCLQENISFENAAHEKAWLFKVTANLSKNRIRYNRIRETDELNEQLVAEEHNDLSFVWEAVKTLPDTYREAIHLFYYEGYQTAQIASILGRKESTVRSDLRRGRERLKEILKEVYDFEEV